MSARPIIVEPHPWWHEVIRLNWPGGRCGLCPYWTASSSSEVPKSLVDQEYPRQREGDDE